MSKFPTCTCQSGMREFAWQVVLSGGPQLNGYTIQRCPDCAKCAYHLPAYGLFFIPNGRSADEGTLRWLYGMEAKLYAARREAGTNLVSVAIEGVPTTITLYLKRGQWEVISDCLQMEVPASVAHVQATLGFVIFFLNPPPICRSAFDE
jgi:hypothetical protein